MPEKTLTGNRLIKDMLPLTFQVQYASKTAMDVLEHIAGYPPEGLKHDQTTFAELYALIDQTVGYLRAANVEDFEGKEEIPVTYKIAKYTWKWRGLGFLQEYVLPNFFFHTTTAYDILRKEGVQIGKLDYVGTMPTELT